MASLTQISTITDLTSTCAACGNQPHSSGIPSALEIIHCKHCTEEYCSADCQASLAETHTASCPMLDSVNKDWPKIIINFLLKTFSNSSQADDHIDWPTKEQLLIQCQQTWTKLTLDEEDAVIGDSFEAYPRFEKADAPRPVVPFSAEVKAHLVALSTCIPYTEDNALEVNSSDMTFIIMKVIGGYERFIGTLRLHPSFLDR